MSRSRLVYVYEAAKAEKLLDLHIRRRLLGVGLEVRGVELDAVYVLSLPGFHWQRSTYGPAQARTHHTYNFLDRANHQMAVIGGWDTTIANRTSWRAQ